jgi:hypothetical protein
MKRKPSKQQMWLWILSLVIVASMVCSFLVSVLPTPSEETPTPAAVITVVAPTSTVAPSGS